MARQMYETAAHLKAERDVANILEKVWGCELKKLSYKLTVDFAIVRKSVIYGWIEVKCRNITYNRNKEYMISMDKINKARQLSKNTNLSFILVVRFTDGIYYYKDQGEQHDLRWGGRFVTQRDEQDLEPCYYIDINLFKKIQ